VALLNESCVQADSLTDLLLNQVVPVAPDLEIVLDLAVNLHDGLSDRPHRLLGGGVDARIHIQLVENQHFFIYLALEYAEKESVCQLAVVHNHLLFSFILAIR